MAGYHLVNPPAPSAMLKGRLYGFLPSPGPLLKHSLVQPMRTTVDSQDRRVTQRRWRGYQRASIVHPHPSVADLPRTRTALRNRGKTRRRGDPGTSTPNFLRMVDIEPALSRFRLEKAITNWKPTRTDPATNFWTVYKKIADEHDNDLVSKYVGNLDTSLLFVSTSVPLPRLVYLNQVLFLR